MLVICVVTNPKYSKVPSFLQPFYIGFTLLAVGVAYGSNGGYALNPVGQLFEYVHMDLFINCMHYLTRNNRLVIWLLVWFLISVDLDHAYLGKHVQLYFI
jgi:glycerol uptake facilitator-like aquaporin